MLPVKQLIHQVPGLIVAEKLKKIVWFFSALYFRPSIFLHFSGAGSRWQHTKQDAPDVPLPSKVFQLLLGEPEVFPGQLGYIIPLANLGPALGSPPTWMF